MIILDLIVTSLQRSGGISVYFENICNFLSKSGERFSIVDDYSSEQPCLGQCYRFLERYRSAKLDATEGVFHSSYYRLPSKRGLKVVTTVHDFTYEKYVRGPARWVHSWQKNRAIKYSDIVICVSQNTARDLMRYCPVEQRKVRVIYNGVSEKYFPITDGLEPSNIVLFVGGRRGYKNFKAAVTAVASLHELELHIVGGGPLNKHERQQLDRLMLNRYKWLGYLSDDDLNLAYNRAYALLYPSSYEGFGIPIIEAMRAGCPVIAVNSSSIPEVAGKAALLVDNPSVDMLISALRQINFQREQLRKDGFVQAAKFSWSRCFEETLAVYQELLHK